MSNKLADWLNADPKPMTKTAFADAIEVSPGYVTQLCGDNPPWPGREIARRIGVVTAGAVTPNDLAGYASEAAA
jgi:DNA-binding transcriptional regulator YdaS (Cro superfamily)